MRRTLEIGFLNYRLPLKKNTNLTESTSVTFDWMLK